MRIHRFGDNLWQLSRLFAFNSYLVREEDGLTVVDTNLEGSAADIIKAASTIGLPIKRITLTHAHGDHAGSLDALAEAVPEAEIILHSRTADFLKGNLTLRPGEPQAKLRGGYVTRATEPTRLIEAGDRVASLRVIAAPGHSPDLIAFLDERDGSLIAGDAFQTQAGIAVAGVMRWLFPFPAMATWHLPTALRSAISLCELNPTCLAVGHGPVLADPVGLMEEAITEALARIDASPEREPASNG